MGARREFHGPRRVERAPSYRSERTRRAQSRAIDRSQRAQRELRQGKEMHKAGQERMKSDAKAAEARGGREGSARTEQRVADKHTQIENARKQLSTEIRDRLHAAFNFDRARVTQAKLDHHVGRHIPRHIRLFPISAAVFAFFPYYRDYSYFVVDDEICIVDPRTYVVVDVIEPGYWRGQGRPYVAELILSEHEIALVRDSIPRDFPEAGLRLRLALGAEIPRDVRLHEFPEIVLGSVPRLRDFRFLVSGDQIVIVRPDDRSVALVIDRV
jgi:hypothetical protein